VLKCKQFCVDAHCNGGAVHRMPVFHAFCSEWPYVVFLVLCSTLLALLWSLVAWITPSALPSSSRKQLPSIFWQADYVCLNFWLVWWMCMHPLLLLLFGFNIQKWNPGFITYYSYNVIEIFITIFMVSLLKKSKLKPFSAFCGHPWAFLETFLNKTCDSLA
jgi:hypothetical protein